MDLTATILAAAGSAAAPTHPLDGIDLLPVLTGREPVHDRTIVWRTSLVSKQGAVRQGGWKYLRDEDGEYLFDLVLDPGERHDRKNDQSARFAELKATFAGWERQMLPPG